MINIIDQSFPKAPASNASALRMFQTITMPIANLDTGFYELLTPPATKHNKEISICSSTPLAHKEYITSRWKVSDVKMSKSHADVLSFNDST